MTSVSNISDAGGIPSGEAFGTPTVTAWFEETLAPMWIEQALTTGDLSNVAVARRREVIFAVAAAESFLIEWVRDDVFKRDLKACAVYLLAREQQSILERWKTIPSELVEAHLIPSMPVFASSTAWLEFHTLVATRNSLVHGNYSRPRTTPNIPGRTRPLTPHELNSAPPGWAVRSVRALVRELCQAAETAPPAWAECAA
jgi:hypothetical protein